MSDQLDQAEAPEETGTAAGAEESVGEVAAEAEAAEPAGDAEAAEASESAEETPEEAPTEESQSASPSWSAPALSSEISRPRVIDIEALLTPIPGDSPSGEYLRYSGIYDEINEARRSDDNLSQGEWQHELKVADYGAVISLGVSAIESQSKDLQLAALLSEALIRKHGFAGLRDSLDLLTGLQMIFWDTLHPEIYEGDMEGRANAVSLVDAEGAMAIQNAPITPDGYSYFDFLDSKKYDIPADIESLSSEEAAKYRALESEASSQGKVTADRWAASLAQSKRAFFEELNVTIEESLESLKALNLAVEEKFDINQAPSTRMLKKALDDIKLQTDKILAQKRVEEPDEVEAEEEVEGEEGATGQRGATGTKGPIQSRAEALRRLSELAAFFRKTEPHSPVSYLVTRAVKWGNMPLESWLQDVIKDESILFQLRQTLGLNTVEGESASEGETYIDETSV